MANASSIFQVAGRASVSIWISSTAVLPIPHMCLMFRHQFRPSFSDEKFLYAEELLLMRSCQPVPGKRQPAQTRNQLRVDPLCRHQHVEGLSHAGGSYQVLELQRDFSALLRHPAVFEHVGKLIRLTDSHQELRLSQQR